MNSWRDKGWVCAGDIESRHRQQTSIPPILPPHTISRGPSIRYTFQPGADAPKTVAQKKIFKYKIYNQILLWTTGVLEERVNKSLIQVSTSENLILRTCNYEYIYCKKMCITYFRAQKTNGYSAVTRIHTDEEVLGELCHSSQASRANQAEQVPARLRWNVPWKQTIM